MAPNEALRQLTQDDVTPEFCAMCRATSDSPRYVDENGRCHKCDWQRAVPEEDSADNAAIRV